MSFKISIERLVGGIGEVRKRQALEFRFDPEGAARVKADELVSPYLDRHYVHQGGFWEYRDLDGTRSRIVIEIA